MAPLDWIVIGALVLSVLVGLWRGLLFEALTLIGWIVAFLLAQWLASAVGDWLPWGEPGAAWRYAAGFALVFVVAAFGIGLLASVLRRLASAAGVRVVDRTLGAAFGLARGVLLLLLGGVAVHLFALNDAPWWRQSWSATAVDAALRGIKPALPEKLASYLP